MDSKKTSVDMTGQALRVYAEHADTYGGNNILCAGLVLFGRLSPDDREKTVKEVNNLALMEFAMDISQDRLDRLVQDSLRRISDMNPALVNYMLQKGRAADQAQDETQESNDTSAA